MSVTNEEVVISGVGGYFPKCVNIDVLKESLLNNEYLLESRWKPGERGVTNIVGTVKDIDYFDTAYFGIHREQCNFMDPMQRMVLERSYEALIDAGVSPTEIKGKRVAVFAGSAVGENDNLFYESIISGFGITGHSRSMMPNRVSYWLNLKGPSCAYDSNWLNGFEVIQTALEVVRDGHCESAIVATANLALNAELSWVYNDMGFLSPDSTTKSFDANANGYARSDGVVVLYIQRASEARRSYATIMGVDITYNGNRNGRLLKMNQDHLSKFIKGFYDELKIDPRDVEFVECYGCGLKDIDQIELGAIDEVYCKDRKKPLMVGTIKPNTGHSEASASLFGIVKVIIAMECGLIPATISYETPNPNIPALIDGRIEVVNKNTEWNVGLAAVNGIGVGSSYGHILLKANPKVKKEQNDGIPRLIAVSSRTDQGIQDCLNLLKSQVPMDPEYASLVQGTFKRAIHSHLYRGYVVLDGTEEPKQEFEYYPGNKRQTWFVYSGMGSQWCKMATDLMVLPIFAEAIHKCHKVLEPKGIDLLKIVTEDDEKMFENILHSFVGIAAVQIGLTDVLHSLGVVPDGIIGHSVGELGCAYADGCLTAEQMILCAYSRGRASLEAELIRGMMAAVGKGYEEMKDKCPPSIEVACHNGPDSCTISGPTEDMEVFVKELQDKGLFARLVNVSNIAYHSRYIKPAAPLLLKYLQEVIPDPLPRTSKWISTSISEEEWDTDLAKTSSAEYHTNNLLSSVLFEEGSKHIPKEAIVIEIAPHGLLQAILKRSLKANCTNIPLTQKTSKNGLTFLLGAVGKMYLAGIDVDLQKIYPKVEYPVSRGTKSLTPLIHWEHGEKWRAGLEDKLNYLASIRDLQISLQTEQYRELVGNQLNNTVIIPISMYFLYIYEILLVTQLNKVTEVVLENLKFKNVIPVPKTGVVSLCIMMQKGNGEFEISSGEELIGTGRIRIPDTEKVFSTVYEIEVNEDALKLTENDIYSEFYHRGHKYNGKYRIIKDLTLTKEGSISTMQWNDAWYNFVEGMLQQASFHKGERNQDVLMISAIQRVAFNISLFPTEPTELKVTYDYATDILSTEAVQVYGISMKPVILERKPISFDSIELTSLRNIEYKNIEIGINLGLNIILKNFDQQVNPDTIMIVEIETENPLFEKNIKNVTNKYTQLSANISSVKDSKMILVSPTQPMYVIRNGVLTENCIKLLTSSHAFMLVRTDVNALNNPQITEVAQFLVDNISYSLLRKVNKIPSVILPIKVDTLSSKDLLRENVSWVNQLKSIVAKDQDNKIYLVYSIVPYEGITNFVQDVRNSINCANVRFVFALDKKAPEFTLKEKVYQHIFRDDLMLTVIKNSSIETYIPTPIEFKKDVSNTLQTSSNIIANTRMDYLGINVRDETLMINKVNHKPELGNIDYSGVTSNGQKIMGLAKLDLEFCKLVPDPILWWDIPKRWSLEDGATVSHAYSVAYYALIHIARIKPSETVLVHGGCSTFGLAAISIASTVGCTIFTTVITDQQKVFMKKQFKFLGDRNIFSAHNTSFEPHLMMATGGEGAHVILNCLSGSMLNATFRCVAEFGKILQMGKLDIEENNEIGMNVFLRNVSVGGVNAEDLVNSSDDVKTKVRDLVQKGIHDITVRPLHKIIVEHQNIESILSKIQEPEHIGKVIIKLSNNIALGQLNVNKVSQFICDSRNSYLVYGGTAEMWADVVEWLIFRGARKIIVSSDSKPQQTHINRRLNLLKSYYNAEIVYAPAKAHTRDSAAELISETYFLGPIGAVFLLPNKNSTTKNSDIKAVQYLDSALKSTAPKALLINFLSNAAGVCQIRTDTGFPTYNVQWENTLEFSDVVHALDTLLSYKAKDIFIKDDQFKNVIQETAQSLYRKLNALLPNSVVQLKEETALSNTKPDFISFPSLCSQTVREVPPLFVVPGMFGKKDVKELAKKLLYPVYCANYPSFTLPLQKVAESFVQRMQEIHPDGPYNIIGISYGGVLATEIGKILERKQARTQLLFIDGAPETIQGILKHLGDSSNSEVSFLCRILNLTNPDIMNNMSKLGGWEARLRFALQQYECPTEDKIYLSETLTNLKKYLDDVSTYQPTDQLFTGQVVLLRPDGASKYDACGLPKYCKQNAEVNVLSGDHMSMMKNSDTAVVINNKIIC